MRMTRRTFAGSIGAGLVAQTTLASDRSGSVAQGMLYIRRYAPALASDGSRAFISGGAPIGAARNDQHEYSSLLGAVEEIGAVTLEQRFLATAIFPRANHASVWMDGKLWLIGGRTRIGPEGRLVSETERINVATQAIWRGPDLPVPLISPSAVTFGGSVFVFGGDFTDPATGRNVASARVFECAPPYGEWRERATMPRALGNAAAVALGGRIYHIGGFDRSRPQALMHLFDPVSDSWSLAPPPPSPLSAHGAAATGGRIFVFGDYENQSSLLGFDPRTGEWRSLALPFTPRRHVRAVTAGNRVVVAGGNQASSAPASDALESYTSDALNRAFDRASS